MNNSASTLSIRMKLPGEEETQRPEPQEEVEYLWDRIIITSVAAVLVIVAAAAGGWHWLGQPELEAQPLLATQAATPAEDGATRESEAISSTQTSAAPAVASAPNSTSPTEPVITTPPPEQVTRTAGGTPVAMDATETRKVQRSEARSSKGADRLAKATTSAAAPAAEPGSQSAGQAPADQPSQPLAKVEILSDHLLHAQLSNGIRGREPVDHAAAVIPMNEEGLVKVFFFTELQDLQGQTVYYDWFLEDKRMARVRARPQLESTHAYSSKFIDRHMLGQWQVKVQTAKGDTLARAEFEVR